jgi:hypothetical protein
MTLALPTLPDTIPLPDIVPGSEASTTPSRSARASIVTHTTLVGESSRQTVDPTMVENGLGYPLPPLQPLGISDPRGACN